ncbi:MAG: phosphatase PAP2 family protein [Dehalococcoidia bacterium]
MTPPDSGVSEWITGFVGENEVFDGVMSLLCTDFFVPVSISLYMLLQWFGTADPVQRVKTQYGIMCASASLGISCGVVAIINNFVELWDRPFSNDENARYAAETLFYLPHDPSFPANLAAVGFGAAAGMWIYDRVASIPIFVLAFLWAISRIYAGAHYPVDILGGMGIAVVVAFLTYGVFRLFHPVPAFFHGLARKVYLA